MKTVSVSGSSRRKMSAPDGPEASPRDASMERFMVVCEEGIRTPLPGKEVQATTKCDGLIALKNTRDPSYSLFAFAGGGALGRACAANPSIRL
ncbi:hypothetical protein ACQ86G_19590 [Roseateles chitinivorans]|uniref:hypothetical protein n=1 Tax=Roseateles chitinivorans TaxID=2917965 RepID=UPI003D673CFE